MNMVRMCTASALIICASSVQADFSAKPNLNAMNRRSAAARGGVLKASGDLGSQHQGSLSGG